MQHELNLKPFNTFGIAAQAQHFASFQDVQQLPALISSYPNLPLLILGGGSNILFTADFQGLVLRNEIKGIQLLQEDAENVYVKSGAGEVWHEFVCHCIDHNWAGLENLSLIPGSVGASPMQNIGAYGVEIKDVFHELSAYHIASGEIHTFDKQQCQFGYRESVFKRALKNQYIIIDVTFKLHKRAEVKTSYGAIQQELEKMGVTEPTIQMFLRRSSRSDNQSYPTQKYLAMPEVFSKTRLSPLNASKQFNAITLRFPSTLFRTQK